MSNQILTFEGRRFLDGNASDPRTNGWMLGTPPPPEKVITFKNDSFRDFPEIRWSLSHIRELVPTANVRRGQVVPLPGGEGSEDAGWINGLEFADLNGAVRSVGQALVDTYTDGILVLHKGRIIYEKYLGALTPELPHACFSITKSYIGTLGAALLHDGVLDKSKTVVHYLPELRDSAWHDATLRQLLDMTTGLAYSEAYEDQNSGVRAYARASGARPRPQNYTGPETLYEYLPTVQREGNHGEVFAYKTVNTEVLAWVIARVTATPLTQLIHKRLWRPLGCEEDAYFSIDSAGTPSAGGGLHATLRDLARFGELMRCEGEWNGAQLLPPEVVAEVIRGGERTLFSAAGYALSPGHSYRNMWWVTHNELDAYEGRGIHGQRLHVAPAAEMVVARFSSHPLPHANGIDPITGPMLLALGRVLAS